MKPNDIELIDLPPDDLLARLRAGKVYIADEAATAAERFFRTPNLMALRELALRRVADRVEAAARALQVDKARVRFGSRQGNGSESVPTHRPSNSCARASGWLMRSTPTGPSSMWKHRGC